MRRYF